LGIKLCHKGFTLIEIAAVLVIIGIIVVLAVGKFRDTGADDLAAANTLKAHLRYAQLRAMGDIVAWGIEIEAEQYTLKKWDEKDERFKSAPVNLPGENEPKKEFEKVAVTQGTGMVSFSPARGQPSDIDSAGKATPLINDQEIKLGSTQIITITRETGFID
jgi:prepilin-type N-terminal cleavage/methylation domain-containing protein